MLKEEFEKLIRMTSFNTGNVALNHWIKQTIKVIGLIIEAISPPDSTAKTVKK